MEPASSSNSLGTFFPMYVIVILLHLELLIEDVARPIPPEIDTVNVCWLCLNVISFLRAFDCYQAARLVFIRTTDGALRVLTWELLEYSHTRPPCVFYNELLSQSDPSA